ncbi:GNAT family N-acetyltransferase [uncultured Paraglaciecola sp.]|jgi:N-acetylglutamate synthase-like GNAT family acetyltransferase|uniref:GNAT family N-acetyltransferase n=1 Tax=uncultured Paraglaciecola sp. TaxID=1765024 RepID=UPI0025FA7A72|nr:GNAT family N-acetyltransferase [uncultured Paraglaciecola sp.]
MGKTLIRFAKPEEAQLLSELAQCSKGHWPYDADFLASCKEELTYNESQLASPQYCFKVAELGNQTIAGFFALNFSESDSPELEALFVDPVLIGQGWGKQLLNAAVSVAKEHKAKSIKLQGDPFAEDFYLANGAVKVGETESNSIPGRFLPLLEICL